MVAHIFYIGRQMNYDSKDFHSFVFSMFFFFDRFRCHERGEINDITTNTYHTFGYRLSEFARLS
jgi:hypothetical protein